MSERTEKYFKPLLGTGLLLLVFLGILYLLRPVAVFLMLVFAGVLLAIFLGGLAGFLRNHTFLSWGWALTLVVVLLFAIAGLFVLISGPLITEQMSSLVERLPQAVGRIKESLGRFDWLEKIFSYASKNGGMAGGDYVEKITGVFSSALGLVANVVIVFFVGLYLAVSPALYIDNLIRLLPREKRGRAREVADTLGHALRWWLVGRLASMAVVGVLTTIGLWLIGAPLALILGLLSGLFSFIPFLGPIISVVPAILVALVQGPSLALAVVVVYLVVQTLESYMITPLIQKRAVSIPPAVLIIAQVLMGILLGGIGVLLATPAAVAVLVVVQLLYLQDVLGEDIRILGDHGS